MLDLVASGTCEMHFSAPIRQEVEQVLKTKFGWDRKEIDRRVETLFRWGTEVHPEHSVAVIKNDPDDDRVLECALAAKAQTIISGDRHLLQLGSFQSIEICTPRQFLERVAQQRQKRKKQ